MNREELSRFQMLLRARGSNAPTRHLVMVEIDLETLALMLGQKAVRSKARRSHTLKGAVRVTVREIEPKGAP